MINTHHLPRLLHWLLVGLLLTGLAASPAVAAPKDGAIKSWTTAELLGAMRWAKAQSEDKKQRREFAAAELICHRRLQQQIDDGAVTRGAAFLIAEKVRKDGTYKNERLTLDRADELRRMIVAGKILQSLTD